MVRNPVVRCTKHVPRSTQPQNRLDCSSTKKKKGLSTPRPPLGVVCIAAARHIDGSRARGLRRGGSGLELQDHHGRGVDPPKRTDHYHHSRPDNEMLLILDGMVLDITRWIDEHPGGAGIIPTQALNMDCTVFFEIYHVSKQALLYIKEFYVGELAPEDEEVLRVEACSVASDGFLRNLREFTSEWRVELEAMDKVVHKSL